MHHSFALNPTLSPSPTSFIPGTPIQSQMSFPHSTIAMRLRHSRACAVLFFAGVRIWRFPASLASLFASDASIADSFSTLGLLENMRIGDLSLSTIATEIISSVLTVDGFCPNWLFRTFFHKSGHRFALVIRSSFPNRPLPNVLPRSPSEPRFTHPRNANRSPAMRRRLIATNLLPRALFYRMRSIFSQI
jgi:hypothetical protein